MKHQTKYRKFGIISLLILLFACVATGCDTGAKASDKLQVVTTLFPQYDFVRQVGGDKVEVTMLLQPGIEAHSYDPTPSDLVKMNRSDLIVYMGPYMETWAEDVFASLETNPTILNLSEGFSLKTLEEEHAEDEHTEDEKEEGHHHVYDPHLWTNPEYAIEMIGKIADKLGELDPENQKYYEDNAGDYKMQIRCLSDTIQAVVDNSELDTLYFAGKFAMYYFAEEYGLKYISAYDSCTSETEPNAKLVAEIIDAVKEKDAPVVFYEELSNHKAADTICQETGAKALLLHSCHNVSKEEFESGITYIQLMYQNVQHLKEGLKYGAKVEHKGD
jgi:zinc transport system substrate-binding protein